jgi:chaperonin GroEL
MSPYFINDMKKLEVNFENAFVLLYNGKIKGLKGLVEILEFTSSKKRPLLIVADNIEGDALQALILNKVNGVLNVAAVRTPGYGAARKEQLKDIATVLGATLLSEDEGHDIANINSQALGDILGTCEKLTVTADKATIVNGKGNKESIEARIQELKNQLEFRENESEKIMIRERLAKLEGGVAILKIGAYSDVELKEKKDRLDDALSATRAAIEEGILPGGGIALLRAAEHLSNKLKNEDLLLNEDEIVGLKILIESCESPLYSILKNAGLSFDVIKKEILQSESISHGYDARNNKYCNLIETGIIDPAKVTRSALENSVSIAGMMITTECTLIEENVDNSIKVDA